MQTETKHEVRWLDPKRIKPGKNPRKYFSPEALQGLKENILEVGQKVAVVVRKIDDSTGKFDWELVAGHRRHKAICEIGDGRKIKAEIVDISDPKELYLFSVVENAARESYTIQEIVEIIAELRFVHSCTNQQIANVFGKSLSWVQNYAQLMALEPSLLQRMSPETPDDKRIRLMDALLVVNLPMQNQELALDDMKGQHPTIKQHKIRKMKQTLARPETRSSKPFDHYKRLKTALNAIEASLITWLDSGDLSSLFERRSTADKKIASSQMLGICRKAAKLYKKLQALHAKK